MSHHMQEDKSGSISFYHVGNTSHSSFLSVRLRDGLICNTRELAEIVPPEGRGGFAPLLAIRIDHLPGVIFLTTDISASGPTLLWVEHYTTRGTVLSVGACPRPDRPDCFAFEDLSRPGKHFTSRPLSEDEKANPIFGDCHQIYGWEEFTLTATDVSASCQATARDIAALFRRNLTADDLLDYIRQYEGENLLPALDSLLPIIRWDELEKFGALLFHTPDLLEKLRKVIPANIWLDQAFPDLITWEKQRQDHARNSKTPFPPRSVVKSPVTDSQLANSGADGSFAGFLQACIHTARKRILPHRRVCLLTTMRNEGLYLLEWIAWHRSIGVEHFFIYSNDNTDKSDILLQVLADEGIVTFISNETDKFVSPQFKAYGHALNILPEILDFEWAFILDGDEFITLNTERYQNLLQYLDWLEHWQTDGLSMNWRFIASTTNFDGLKELDKPLILRNERIVGNGAIGDGWRLVKSACKPRNTLHSRPHHPVWNHMENFTLRLGNAERHEYRMPPPGFPHDPAFADKGDFEHICISHFYFKSMAEWTWKHARNSGADAFQEISTERYTDQWANAFGMQLRDPQYETNIWILERKEMLLAELNRLRSVTAIRKAENDVRRAVNKILYHIVEQITQEDIIGKIKEEWRFIFTDLSLELTGEIPLLPPVSNMAPARESAG